MNAEISGAARAEYSRLVEQESEQSAKLTQCRTSAVMLTERLQECRQRQVQVNGAMLDTEDKLTEIGEKLREAKSRKKEAGARKDDAQKQAEEKRSAMQQAAAALEKLREQRGSLVADLKADDSRISLLEDMEKEHEGYNRAVRFVLKEYEKGSLNGVRGAVGELSLKLVFPVYRSKL